MVRSQCSVFGRDLRGHICLAEVQHQLKWEKDVSILLLPDRLKIKKSQDGHLSNVDLIYLEFSKLCKISICGVG